MRAARRLSLVWVPFSSVAPLLPPRHAAKSSMYRLPMCVLFFAIARCASAGLANVTHASPLARPSRWPMITPPGTVWKPPKKRTMSSIVARNGTPRIRSVDGERPPIGGPPPGPAPGGPPPCAPRPGRADPEAGTLRPAPPSAARPAVAAVAGAAALGARRPVAVRLLHVPAVHPRRRAALVRHHVARHVPADELLERLQHLGARDAEQLDVAAAHALAVARHRALALVGLANSTYATPVGCSRSLNMRWTPLSGTDSPWKNSRMSLRATW